VESTQNHTHLNVIAVFSKLAIMNFLVAKRMVAQEWMFRDDGNIWLLAMIGYVLAYMKFGGQTKLAAS